MIKKLLSSVLFVASVGVAGAFAQANCTPDISCIPVDTTFGICPDTIAGLPHGLIGTPYSVTMSIKIPGTTTYQGQSLALTHLGLTKVWVDTVAADSNIYSDGFPDSRFVDLTTIGLDYDGSGVNTPNGASGVGGYTMTKHGYWDAPGSACVVVSGTPTKVGTFHIRIISFGRVNFSGFGIWNSAPVNNHYKLIIAPNGSMGIESIDMSKFEVMQNAPNPFSEKTEIRFNSPSVNVVDFKVYNLVGAVVYTESVKAEKGENTITLKANAFAPGVYMYSVKNGAETITKRMVVTQ